MNKYLLSAVSSALAAQLASAQIGFQPAVPLATGVNPDATAIGDFNGDGKLDLAVTSDAPDKVSIFLNQGNASFGAAVNVMTGSGTSPHTPVAGDLDGDGDVDIAVSLKNTGAVRILVNQGSGTFTLGPSFTVGSDPRAMAIGDLDGDGDLDLGVSNRGSDTVSVLRNTGSMVFTVASYASGTDPRELDFGDVTGDGLADIAVAAHGDRAVRVLANAGSATFTQLATLSLGQLRPQGIAIGQLNGVGPKDIAASAGNNGVEFASIVLSQGNGTFGGVTNFPLIGLDASSMVAADFDLDGDLDLATANTDSNNVSALANNGAGAFGAAQLFGVGSNPGNVVAGDLDQNASPDLVATNETSNNVSILLNTNSGSTCNTTVYCQGKANSLGLVASIGSTGTPSVSTNDFVLTMSNGVPGKNGIAFYSLTGAANAPFQGGTLCAQAPLIRLPVQTTSAGGTMSYAIPVAAGDVGTTRWFQFWYRDPQNPDGTNVALSNALAVTFCD